MGMFMALVVVNVVFGAMLRVVAFVHEHDARLGNQPALLLLAHRRRGACDVGDRSDMIPIDAVANAEGNRRRVDADATADSSDQKLNWYSAHYSSKCLSVAN